MLEIAILFLALIAIGLIAKRSETSAVEYCSSGVSVNRSRTVDLSDNKFLGQLQQNIETNLLPRPSDATLSRHYDALIKEKIEDQLCLMPNS